MSLLYADTYGKGIGRQGLTLVAEFTTDGEVIRRFDLARTPPDFDLETELAAIELGFEPPQWYHSFQSRLSSPITLVWTAFSERPLEFTQFLVAEAKRVGNATAAFMFFRHRDTFAELSSRVLELADRLSELGPVPEEYAEDVLELMLDEVQEHERAALVDEARELREEIKEFWRGTRTADPTPLSKVAEILELATDTLEVDWYDEDGDFDAAGLAPFLRKLMVLVDDAFDAQPGMTLRRLEELAQVTATWMLGESVRLIERQQAELA